MHSPADGNFYHLYALKHIKKMYLQKAKKTWLLRIITSGYTELFRNITALFRGLQLEGIFKDQKHNSIWSRKAVLRISILSSSESENRKIGQKKKMGPADQNF